VPSTWPGAWRGSDLQGANGGTRSRSDSTVREVIAKYRAWFLQQPDLMAALPCSGRSNPLLSISREPATKTGRAEGLKFAGSRNARDVPERAPVALSPHVRTMRRMCAAVQCSCGGNHGRGRHRALAYLSRARGGTRCAAERRTHARAPPRLAEACIEQSWRAHPCASAGKPKM